MLLMLHWPPVAPSKPSEKATQRSRTGLWQTVCSACVSSVASVCLTVQDAAAQAHPTLTVPCRYINNLFRAARWRNLILSSQCDSAVNYLPELLERGRISLEQVNIVNDCFAWMYVVSSVSSLKDLE